MARRGLLRDIVGILGTRMAWTLMGLVTGIVLARMLGPHDRGVLALLLLLPSTVVSIVKLGISQATVYAINRKGHSVVEVASNVASLALLLGTLAAVACWFLREWLTETFFPGAPPWLFAAALVRVPAMLLDDYLFGVLQATGRYSIYNIRLIFSEALRVVGVVLALVVFELGLATTVFLYMAITLINIVWLVVSTRRVIPFRLRVYGSLLRELLSFGFKSYVQTLTSHMLLRIDIYMVAALLKSPADVAFYSLALRFTEMVLEIPQAVGLVLYPRLASIGESEIYRLTAQACRRTLLLSGVGAMGIAVLGPYVLLVWYGEAYAPAGEPLPWAAVGVVAMSIFVILSRAFTSQHRQYVNIAAGLVALVGNVVLNLHMIPAYGIVGAAMATAISYGGASLLLLGAFSIESGLSPRTVLLVTGDDTRYFRDVFRRGVDQVLRWVGSHRPR